MIVQGLSQRCNTVHGNLNKEVIYKYITSGSVRSISRHMASVDTQNSAILGAIPPKKGENLSEM